MAFSKFRGGRFAATLLSVGMLALAGCQSAGVPLPGSGAAAEPPADQINVEDLRAYCPRVGLREGTAYFSTYERGGDGDRSRLVYQATIADVTRTCAYEGGMLRMTVAVAGRIIPGPKGSTGTIRMPIRIAVVQGSDVVYSQLHQYDVQVADTAGATQFVFTDTNVVFPMPPQRNVQAFAGYDEGPGS